MIILVFIVDFKQEVCEHNQEHVHVIAKYIVDYLLCVHWVSLCYYKGLRHKLLKYLEAFMPSSLEGLLPEVYVKTMEVRTSQIFFGRDE